LLSGEKLDGKVTYINLFNLQWIAWQVILVVINEGLFPNVAHAEHENYLDMIWDIWHEWNQ